MFCVLANKAATASRVIPASLASLFVSGEKIELNWLIWLQFVKIKKKYTKLGPFMLGSTQKPSVGEAPARERESIVFTLK